MPGIEALKIRDTPISVIDFETTGMMAGRDRVVEMTVMRCNPGERPQLVLDTLVNPARGMGATEIHGITDRDVQQAPRFEDVAGELLEAIEGTVVTAYNVYFDIKFLNYELERVGVRFVPPHFCLMYLRPMLGIGKRCKLDEACHQHGITLSKAHIASDDARASAELLGQYLNEIDKKQIDTFGDLADLRYYKFTESFSREPLPGPNYFKLTADNKAYPRGTAIVLTQAQIAVRTYWETIKSVVADLEATDEEVLLAVKERKQLGLTKDQVRFLHARAFGLAIMQFIDDQLLDDSEARKLQKLHSALSRMGWAPGE